MQMPALLLAILLAGGNPVWDRQSNAGQAQICSETVAAQTESVAAGQVAAGHVAAGHVAAGQKRKARRGYSCAAEAKPLAEAPAPAVQTR